MTAINIKYVFRFAGGAAIEFPLEFEEPGFDLVVPERRGWPAWTALEAHKCSHCPLDAASSPRCPLAASLVDVVEGSLELVSHGSVEAEAILPDRTVSVSTNAGEALRSLMGLIIPASGCPHTAFFKPMARFHLPFSSAEETLYRACSMHRLAQQLRAEAGVAVSDGFGELAQVYADINLVNQHVVARLQDAAGEDSSRSAVALLDVFAQLIPFQFDQALDDLRALFEAYLR
jgi:hypothetical protein